MLLLLMMMNVYSPSQTLVDFSSGIGIEWINVDDDVMGGKSQSKFTNDEEGNGVFYGVVSLENNGGFSSIRHRFSKISITDYSMAVLKVKGDKKRYQFRVKSSLSERHSYKYHFETSGEWETIEIPLKKMEPTWRGMKLNLPDFPVETLAEIGFLISNKKAEPFELKIASIELR